MRPPRVLHTAAFRLALGYAGLFTVSTACLLAAVYLVVTDYTRDQHEDVIESEWESLATEARSSGLDPVAARIRSWETEDQDRPADYLLIDAAGARLAGDLRVAPGGTGWFSITTTDDDGDPEPMLAYAGVVPGGVLIVAKETQDLRDLHGAIVTAFAWAGGVGVLLAIAGGLVMSLIFRRRIDRFTTTTGRIIDGRLGERVPLSRGDDEFDRLARNVNVMLDRIESLIESLRQVSSDVAHDLRTPLTRLRQRLETARSTPRSLAQYEDVLAAAVEETDEILSTFAALLRIAEIESGTGRAGFTDVDLSRVFSTIAEAYAPATEDTGGRLTASIEPEIMVRGDPELLTQMLSNLIENALRHTPAGSAVGLSLDRTAHGAVGIVSDDGPGIPEAVRAEVFRRFYRGEGSRGSPGNGLGLSLVAAVADLHGITIELSDRSPGLGVVMTFDRSPP